MESEHGQFRIAVVLCGVLPKNTGGASRAVSTILALRALGSVKLYFITNDRVSIADLGPIADSSHFVFAEGRRVRPHDYLRLLLGVMPRRLLAADIRGKRRKLEQAWESQPDLIWAYNDQAFLCLPASLRRSSVVVVDLIDFEAERDVNLARAAPTHRIVRTAIARLEGRALRRTLHRIAAAADRTAISSDVDRQRLGSARVSVLPNAYRLVGPPVGQTHHVGSPVFLFVGSLGYGPNRDAIDWLVTEVWPAVVRKRPDAQLRIVGRGLANPEKYESDRITVVGEVSTMEPELSQAWVSLAPIRFGSGSRIKILEAWAHGVPVISTTIGAEGLLAGHELNLLIADSPVAFAEGMLRLVDNQNLREMLAREGQKTWSESYSDLVFSDAVVSIAMSALSGAESR